LAEVQTLIRDLISMCRPVGDPAGAGLARRHRSWSARRLCALALPLLLLAAGARAEAPALSFATSLARLWQGHPEVLQAEAGLRAAGYDKSAAYTGFLPYAQLDMARSEDGDEQVARVILPLWRGGLNFAALDVAEASQIAAVADLQRTRLRLGLRLAEAYFGEFAAREQDAEWRHYLAVLVQLQGLIERRAAGGVSPEADVQTVLTRLRQAEAEAALNESLRAASEAQYVALVGEFAVPAGWPAEGGLLAPPEIATALQRDLDEHPELAFAKARAVREAADARRSRAQLSPELSLRHTEPFGDEATVSTPVTQLVLQYQTDNGLRAYQGYKAGQQRQAAAEAAIAAARRDVTAALASARAEYAAARAQLGFQGAAVSASDAVVASALRQFEAGRKTWIEVLNAQREAHENRLQQVRQRQRLWQANARLALQGLLWERLLHESAAALTPEVAPQADQPPAPATRTPPATAAPATTEPPRPAGAEGNPP
jgi:outer membrane protein TolC